MARQLTLLIAIADGEHARLITRADDNALHTHTRIDSRDAHKQTSDLVTDHAGRVHESASPTRHGITPKHDPHEQARFAFARHVATQVNAADAENRFDQLVLVAPADILHAIQAELADSTRARVVSTLAKDLVKVPDHELQSHLAQWVHPVVRVR